MVMVVVSVVVQVIMMMVRVVMWLIMSHDIFYISLYIGSIPVFRSQLVGEIEIFMISRLETDSLKMESV